MHDPGSRAAGATPKQKLRVLFVANASDLGGASLAMLSEVERLPKERFSCLVVVPDEGLLVGALTAAGIPTVQVYQPWWTTSGTEDAWLYAMRRLPEAVNSLQELIRKEHIDVVCTNTSVIPAGAMAAALEDRPHVWRPHEFIGQGGLNGPLDAVTIRRCIATLSSHVAAGSMMLARDYLQDGVEAKVSGVFSGIDCTQFANCAPDLTGGTILSIAATKPSKGLGDLLAAATILSRRSIDFRVIVVGGFEREPYRQQIQKQILAARLTGQFELAGYQEELVPFLDQASIYCCPSHTEGMSRVVVEAMAAGLPVVSTDCGGPRDLVEEGATGSLVPVRNPEALAEALAQMLANPARRVSMGEAGRRRAMELFDLKATVPQLAGILEEATHSRPACQAKPLAQLLMTLLEVGGPRILLGKKWRLFKTFIR